MASVFRADPDNVGDWWSAPFRWFPLRPSTVYDLIDARQDFADEKIVVVGGGGLGTSFFKAHIERLKRADRPYKLIAWGVGVDEVRERGAILDSGKDYELFGTWFDGFDDVGIRAFSENQKYRWVPCASCMAPAFFKLRATRPDRRIGLFQHMNVPLAIAPGGEILTTGNRGKNLTEKLEFLARHEFIVTNTYHGVYWATLLNRKVLCVPFKSGLFSFKHRPVYLKSPEIGDAALAAARAYPESLDEAREANIAFYRDLIGKYGDI
ncbi:MAG TPA: hypothetical protein VLW75_01100 [Rhizomicrobium sp.]|nr:hypothetical protein [Rhizomicrobium sp.]